MRRGGRFPERTGDARTDAQRELRWAMLGSGLTIDKIAVMSSVGSLPAVLRESGHVADDQAAATALAVVTDAARALGDGVHARLLRTALAIDYAGTGKDLTSRRAEFVAAYNAAVRAEGRRDCLSESARSLMDIENEMLDSLVTLLGAGPSTPERPPSDRAREQTTTRGPVAEPMPIDSTLLHVAACCCTAASILDLVAANPGRSGRRLIRLGVLCAICLVRAQPGGAVAATPAGLERIVALAGSVRVRSGPAR